MDPAWQILRDGGLPLVVPGPRVRRSAAELASAVRVAIAENPTGRQADALAAFVLAWRHHWAASYAQSLAADAQLVTEWATANVTDPNRYLKLRRIAIENLSTVL